MEKEKPSSLRLSLEMEECQKPLFELAKKFDNPENIVAMNVNGLTRNLNETIHGFALKKVELYPIYRDSPEGIAILKRSIVFIMSKALYELNPERKTWYVEHMLKNGYYCRFRDAGHGVNKDFCGQLTEKMLSLSSKNLLIRKKKMYYEDALEYFKTLKQNYTVKLLSTINKYTVSVDECESFMNLHHRVLCPNTSYIKDCFEIIPKDFGWVINFPFCKYAKLYGEANTIGDRRLISINKERNDFVRGINIECVGDINTLVRKNEIDEFISLNNLYQDMVMNRIVRRVMKDKENVGCKLILVSGPSASGKTTFAKKLQKNFMCKGLHACIISIDNYLKPKSDCEIDPITGEVDFESLKSLRLEKLNNDLKRVLKGEEVMLPTYDYFNGFPNDKGRTIRLEEDSFLILEGIHCLNEDLTSEIPPSLKYKIFVYPFSPVNLDDRNYLSNKVIRLIRRIVRDSMKRGKSIHQILKHFWPRGEEAIVFPRIKEADFIFNSALDYEICVLKPYAIPLLKTVKPSSPQFEICVELLTFLDKFETIPYKYVPRDSLLQEFIGGHWFN